MDWQIDGHKRQLEFLENALQKDKLAHAYTFAGPHSVGKKTIARELARELLKSEGNNFHPDLLEINGEAGIKIEQIRELVYKLSLKPYQAKYKVAIIDGAENMTIEAANALLKSLEEPKPYTIIILITSNPNRLPKTILSRTQKINFGLIRRGLEQSESVDEFYKTFISEDLIEKLIAAYDMADLETEEIKKLLNSWLLRLEQELLSSPTKKLASKISQLAKTRQFLDQNVNAKLLLTNLMINTS